MRDIAALFAGRDDAYGQYGSLLGVQPTDRGKRAAGVRENRTVRGPVTADLWQSHLAGDKRLGIVPIMRNDKVNWSVIDVDHYDKPGMHEDIAAKIAELGLPLVPTRSKSNGAHLWCFYQDPILAARAMAIMASFAKKLGLPEAHVEIFPKQAHASDAGSWVNMPYFGANTCTWVGLNGKGDHSLQDFVEYANSKLWTPTEEKKEKKAKSDLPPCIDKMMANGVESDRNTCLTQYGIMAKKRWPDEWQDKVSEFNSEYMSPPLDQTEVRSVINSVANKGYEYLCKQIKPLGICDQSTCMTRAFGIGGGMEIDIQGVEKLDGEVPLYLVKIDDKIIQCKQDDFYYYHKFRPIAFGVLDRFLPQMKQPQWEEFTANLMAAMKKSETAADTQMAERVMRQFMLWCSISCTSDDPEIALTAGLPCYVAPKKEDEDGNIYFQGNDFMSIIDRTLKISRDQTWLYMRDRGVAQTYLTIDGRRKGLWCFKAPKPLWFDPDKGKKE